YKEGLLSVVRKGKSGAEEIQQMMKDYRANPPAEIAGSKVVRIRDIKTLEERDTTTGTVTKIDLPTSNVLQFFTADGNKVTVRPSGTEPKIKFYFGVKGQLPNKEGFDQANEALDQKIETIKRSMNLV
ncbi:MAG: phospho-sugar mutase, partial [Bacteroidales bacterium]|nr:phospho-sugar mutase [Bacteroidales bacterium]